MPTPTVRRFRLPAIRSSPPTVVDVITLGTESVVKIAKRTRCLGPNAMSSDSLSPSYSVFPHSVSTRGLERSSKA
eukprot:7568083-Prorocentrum_lima.AAC.1